MDYLNAFAETLAYKLDDISTAHNYCPDCVTPMVIQGCEYKCLICGRTDTNETSAAVTESTSGGYIKSIGANGRGRHYNVAADYSKTQYRAILTLLQGRAQVYTGIAFAPEILATVAHQYNDIQTSVKDDKLDDNGAVVGKKKFVRRSNTKDEILSALMYFECNKRIPRRRRDIAKFNQLVTDGFSGGEEIIRGLVADNRIDIVISEETAHGYADRYIEALDMDPVYYNFVVELVTLSETNRVGLSSQLSSKVVGAIYIVICKKRLNISTATIEKSTDNTKKNTFMKFYDAVMANRAMFIDVFKRHNIPL
jgi:hypothetical protein